MPLELRIVGDPCRELTKHRSRTFGIDGGTIGRSSNNYWVLPDPNRYVSSYHCQIECIDGEYWLRDTSRNGVFLNGAKVPVGPGNKVPLRTGDRIRLGEYEFLAEVHERPRHPVRTTVFDAGSLLGPDVGVHGAIRDTESTGTQPGTNRAADVAIPYVSSPEGTSGANSRPSMFESAATYVESAINRIKDLVPDWENEQMAEPGASRDAALEVVDPHMQPAYRTAQLDAETMERHCILLSIPDQTIMRAYKILRTRLRRRMIANDWRSMAITGEGQGVGKTVTAINLAITCARDARTPVFLVDLDLYRPAIANYLGMKVDKGLSDFLLGEAEINDILYSPGVEGLVIVPNNRPLDHASELLASPRMGELVRYLETRVPKRVILYDMPPLLMSDDVLVFSPRMDCVLDVVGVGVTERAALERSRELLSELNVAGVVLNRSTARDDAGHYYYY